MLGSMLSAPTYWENVILLIQAQLTYCFLLLWLFVAAFSPHPRSSAAIRRRGPSYLAIPIQKRSGCAGSRGDRSEKKRRRGLVRQFVLCPANRCALLHHPLSLARLRLSVWPHTELSPQATPCPSSVSPTPSHFPIRSDAMRCDALPSLLIRVHRLRNAVRHLLLLPQEPHPHQGGLQKVRRRDV